MASSTVAVRQMEDLTEQVAEWVVEMIDLVFEAICPDGRPFGMERQTQAEQLETYVTNLRGNPQGWVNWVTERVNQVFTHLADLPPEMQASVHPWDIVERAALEYSARMEALYQKLVAPAGMLGMPTAGNLQALAPRGPLAPGTSLAFEDVQELPDAADSYAA